MLYFALKDESGTPKPLSRADWDRLLLLSSSCSCKDCARRRVLGPGFRRSAIEDVEYVGCTFWCEKRGWIPGDGTARKGIDSPPGMGKRQKEHLRLGGSLPGLRNPFRAEVTLGDEDETAQHLGKRKATANERLAEDASAEAAMRVQEEEDSTDDDTPAPKRQRRKATRSAPAVRDPSAENAVPEQPKREETRSATAVNRVVAGNDDAIPKAAVPSRAGARRATATRGAQASRHKTSGLRPSVRPKLEDDKSAIKLDSGSDAEDNSMRTRANNLYLLGISKENSELITANGASHLARFLELKRSNIQPGGIKPEPVKVEERARVIVLGPQINQADELVAARRQETETIIPPSTNKTKMIKTEGKEVKKEEVKKEAGSPGIKLENKSITTTTAQWNITKDALRPNKKAPTRHQTPQAMLAPKGSSSVTGSGKEASASGTPTEQKVLILNYAPGSDPLKSRKPSLFDDAYRSAMASVASTPSPCLSIASTYGQPSSTPPGSRDVAKQQRKRMPCSNCQRTGVQTHHRGPSGYNFCALCNKTWSAMGKPRVCGGMSSSSVDDDDDRDELGDETLVNEDAPPAFRGAGLRLDSWQPPVRPQTQQHASKRRAHAATELLGDEPPRKAQKTRLTRLTIHRQLLPEVEEHSESSWQSGLAGSNKEVHAASAANVSAGAPFSKGSEPCGLCKTPNPSEPVHYSLWKSQKDGERQLYCHKCYMKDYMRRRKKPEGKEKNQLQDVDESAIEEDAEAEESMEKYKNGSKVVGGAHTIETALSNPTVELYTTLCGRLFDLEKLEKEDQARLVVALKAVDCAEAKRTSDKTTLTDMVKELGDTQRIFDAQRRKLMNEFDSSRARYRALVESFRNAQAARHKTENEFVELAKFDLGVQGVEGAEETVKRFRKNLEGTAWELQEVREQLKKLAGRDS